jgi:hypothetical protein
LQWLLRQLGQPLQQCPGHLRANNGGDLHQAFDLRGEAVEARCQHRLDGVRQGQGAGGVAVFSRRPGQLLQKEGIPRRLGHYRLVLVGGELRSLRHRLHHSQAGGRIEWRQRHLGGPGVRQPGQPIARPIRGQQ